MNFLRDQSKNEQYIFIADVIEEEKLAPKDENNLPKLGIKEFEATNQEWTKREDKVTESSVVNLNHNSRFFKGISPWLLPKFEKLDICDIPEGDENLINFFENGCCTLLNRLSLSSTISYHRNNKYDEKLNTFKKLSPYLLSLLKALQSSEFKSFSLQNYILEEDEFMRIIRAAHKVKNYIRFINWDFKIDKFYEF
jgi:hypothetical protein